MSIAARPTPEWRRPLCRSCASDLPCDFELRLAAWRRICAVRSAQHPWSAGGVAYRRLRREGLGADRGYLNARRGLSPLSAAVARASARRPSRRRVPTARGDRASAAALRRRRRGSLPARHGGRPLRRAGACSRPPAPPGAGAGRVRARCVGFRAAPWLILPVVICLSQRLSHACLSTSQIKVKPRMAH